MKRLGNGGGKPEVDKRLLQGETGQHRRGEAQEGGNSGVLRGRVAKCQFFYTEQNP